MPAARASILWLLGEYSELVPTIAPDVLRKMAKSFINEVILINFSMNNINRMFLGNRWMKLIKRALLLANRKSSYFDRFPVNVKGLVTNVLQ